MANRSCYFIPEDGSTYHSEHGFRVAVAFENEAGYSLTGGNDWETNPRAVRPYFYGHDFGKAVAACDEVNAQRGISVKDSEAIIMSSIAAQVRQDKPTGIAGRRARR